METEHVMIHWRYFISLERDVEILKNYIEITEDNFNTFSMEIFKILQLTCSEIDSVCRVLCKEIDLTTNYDDKSVYSGNISQYKTTITTRFPRIVESEVYVHGLNSVILPWQDWQLKNSPEWWVGYNKAKHYRHSSYKSANLKNMLIAMSGLMTIIMYLYRLSKNEPYANPYPHPNIFLAHYFSPTLILTPNKELPDFES